MVNRACDFCTNSYRKNPKAGYFRVTQAMRIALGVRDQENQQRDFVCGLHFSADCYHEDGRLKSGSIPTFFPQLASAQQDHPYYNTQNDDTRDYDGGKA